MSENVKFKVKILAIGKADITVEAEDATAAVRSVVTDFARRGGESAHMMARRLDKEATVTFPSGAKAQINVIESCPAPADDEIASPDTLSDEIRDGIVQTIEEDGFGI